MEASMDVRPKVAIVDDDADFLAALEHLLKPLYRVTVISGAWTCALVAAAEPDLILLDGSAAGAGRPLREDERFSGTPILFVACSKVSDGLHRLLGTGGARFPNEEASRRRLAAMVNEELALARSRPA
jgi:CheY-like chemotaxis protein